ncbi:MULTISPECIES: helix-turn-helix domain-containing protein [Niallia]|uniref:Helix-turn-helix domain-containing protein n=1 Tax=Niallia alba TaxID=2729105 RepID=A0A7Y0KC37_9BACI|nr:MULTISPECIES: helix-turn-helix domain-containing protein [Niallia]EOR24111.1 hypothetical protein A499_09174 [Niallia nealsonii AAU1]NMO79724.1 helix-turn-helix domain-containing protein [Niallia alba]UTI42981.1 helix-turn-helix domain-containing protein [Niallia sp. RD1]
MWKSVLTGLLMTFVFLTGCSNESTESMEEMLKESGKTVTEIKDETGISKSTLYRYLESES